MPALPAHIQLAHNHIQNFKEWTPLKKDFGKEIKRTMEKAKVLSTQNDIEIKEKIMRGDTGYNIIKLAHDKKEKYD